MTPRPSPHEAFPLPIVVGALLFFACAPELVPSQGIPQVTIESEDGRTLDAVSRAPRLRVRGLDPEQAVPDLRLFQGEISSYANNRLRRREVIAALTKREVSLSVWTEPDAVVVAPAAFLVEGESYRLAALGRGVLGELAVAEEGAASLQRLWPQAVHPRGEVVYCLDDAAPPLDGTEEPSPVPLAPFAAPVEVVPGVGDRAIAAHRCVSLRPREDLPGEFVVPPASFGGAWFDPEPVAVWPSDETPAPMPESPACDEVELVVGDVCGRFDGAELAFEPLGPSAWFVRAEPRGGGDAQDWFRVALRGEPLALQPFEPWTEYQVFAHRLDDRGLGATSNSGGVSGEPRPRVVINEVLSNPVGPEPQGEWVELVNVGAASAFLDGWVLEDATGPTALPDVELPPGAYGLIVGTDYSALAGDDVVPSPDAIPVVVERVGHRGLTNGGEPLRLIDAAGRVVSSVPAIAASRAGSSVARRDPWSSDGSEAFGRHAPPGASPGGPNDVE